MDESTDPQNQTLSTTEPPAPLPDVKQHETAAAAARANAESLVAAIQGDAQV